MENKGRRNEKKNIAEVGKPIIWDSGSSLYDSFELESFERKLHSAINSRTLSMPHLSDRRRLPPAAPPQMLYQTQPSHSHDHKSQYKKLSTKIFRSIFRRLLCFVQNPKQRYNNSSGSFFQAREEPLQNGYNKGGIYVYDDTSNSDSVGLSTILEAPEIDSFSPKFGSDHVVRRTASERFRADSMSISCT